MLAGECGPVAVGPCEVRWGGRLVSGVGDFPLVTFIARRSVSGEPGGFGWHGACSAVFSLGPFLWEGWNFRLCAVAERLVGAPRDVPIGPWWCPGGVSGPGLDVTSAVKTRVS